ncbi:dihydrofolate reductase family protein [Devosia ginsengisoli]|uniref:dihydrofolate reductase family protein n=1 Tax=Devosia ginsengisoli TaxID=400770 RepID=UPI0026F20324|nr:dihydrofolate reductase family protein [Devosia ginsengisoli]MCR6670438.1 dihydrofolate reductase family protein [Devosia ginsengisoli]
MRKVILGMMTTLNGRLDSPFEWVDAVGDDVYRQINENAATSDTMLIGRTTYDEMVAYWPGTLASGEGTASNQAMARHMHDIEKLVISRSGSRALEPWHRARMVTAADDAALVGFITELKAQEGGDIHLSGGAGLVQSMVRLGLVDRFNFFVFPTVSPGAAWFGDLTEKRDMNVVDVKPYDSGVVGLSLEPRAQLDMGAPQRFTELLS